MSSDVISFQGPFIVTYKHTFPRFLNVSISGTDFCLLSSAKAHGYADSSETSFSSNILSLFFSETKITQDLSKVQWIIQRYYIIWILIKAVMHNGKYGYPFFQTDSD